MVSQRQKPAQMSQPATAIVLILFCNILVFLFVATRWASQTRRLFGAVARVCVGEGLLLLLMYAAGRYCIGA